MEELTLRQLLRQMIKDIDDTLERLKDLEHRVKGLEGKTIKLNLEE